MTEKKRQRWITSRIPEEWFNIPLPPAPMIRVLSVDKDPEPEFEIPKRMLDLDDEVQRGGYL